MFPFALLLNTAPSQHNAEFIAIIDVGQTEHNSFSEVWFFFFFPLHEKRKFSWGIMAKFQLGNWILLTENSPFKICPKIQSAFPVSTLKGLIHFNFTALQILKPAEILLDCLNQDVQFHPRFLKVHFWMLNCCLSSCLDTIHVDSTCVSNRSDSAD